jgi:hypothetical protein
VLCDAVTGRGGSWNTDGTLLFTGQAISPVSRIAASGGIVTSVTTIDPGRESLGSIGRSFCQTADIFCTTSAAPNLISPGCT